MTAPPLVGCVVWSHHQGLGRYILETTEGNTTDDLQSSWEIDSVFCTFLEYKPTRHKLQKHPICIERGPEDYHLLSQDVQCRPHARRYYNAEGKGTIKSNQKLFIHTYKQVHSVYKKKRGGTSIYILNSIHYRGRSDLAFPLKTI